MARTNFREGVLIALISTTGSIIVAAITAFGMGSFAGARAGADATIPKNTISFFNLERCPTGWSPRSDAEGRYLVGLKSTHLGSLGQAKGTPLDDLEDRATGNHTHQDNTSVMQKTSGYAIARGYGPDAIELRSVIIKGNGVDIQNSKIIPSGTNAPYLQLLVCEKV